jgi:hypothetical protein
MIATFAKGSGLVKQGRGVARPWAPAFEVKAGAGRLNDLRPLLTQSGRIVAELQRLLINSPATSVFSLILPGTTPFTEGE